MLRSRRSEETLSTLVSERNDAELENSHRPQSRPDDSDIVSLFTTTSEETKINEPITIFGLPLSTYNVLREMPIVSTFLHSGVCVFESIEAFQQYNNETQKANTAGEKRSVNPLLQVSSSVLGMFKIKSPFITIHRYTPQGEKVEYCKVYFKVKSSQVSYYLMRFIVDGHTHTLTLMNNNSHKPSVDLVHKQTKLRISGISGTTSTFGGAGDFKMHVLRPESKILEENPSRGALNSTERSSNLHEHEESLFSAIEHQNRALIQKYLSVPPLINIPIAHYIEDGAVRQRNKFNRIGTVRVFDRGETGGDDTLMLVCIMLVMREQESRKNKGSKLTGYG